MKQILKKTAVAAALTMAFTSAAFAQATLTNGSMTVGIDASGNIRSSGGDGTPGLSYNGNEFINLGTPSSWYALSTGGTVYAQYGSNPLGATTSPSGPTAATTLAVGGLNVSMTSVLTAPNKMSTMVTLTNAAGGVGDISGVRWGVGFDPDQGVPNGDGFETYNVIQGQGGSAAVLAGVASNTNLAITLSNTTLGGANDVRAYINDVPFADCCSAVNPAFAFANAQSVGYGAFEDASISLSYDVGTVADNSSVTFGYEYTISAIPEPETYALLLAGLGLMGFVARRRRNSLAA